jgi:hypothetical protein
MLRAVGGSRGGMAIGAIGEPHGEHGAVDGRAVGGRAVGERAVGERAAALRGGAQPAGVQPGGTRWGAARVRRPADLLLAVFALAVVAVVLGSVRALPLGSTEAADDVSRWLLHIPRWLAFGAAVVAGVGCFALVVVSLPG